MSGSHEHFQHLGRQPRPTEIAEAAASILRYLEEENPYLLTYRVGPRRGEAMARGLEELHELARWVSEAGLSLELTPVRRYTSPETGEEITQTRQGAFKRWM